MLDEAVSNNTVSRHGPAIGPGINESFHVLFHCRLPSTGRLATSLGHIVNAAQSGQAALTEIARSSMRLIPVRLPHHWCRVWSNNTP